MVVLVASYRSKVGYGGSRCSCGKNSRNSVITCSSESKVVVVVATEDGRHSGSEYDVGGRHGENGRCGS